MDWSLKKKNFMKDEQTVLDKRNQGDITKSNA